MGIHDSMFLIDGVVVCTFRGMAFRGLVNLDC